MDIEPKTLRGFDKNEVAWQGKGHRARKVVRPSSQVTFENFIWEDDHFWNDQNIWREM